MSAGKADLKQATYEQNQVVVEWADDHRVLHGRTDLTIDGQRWLQWVQIERGDFHSSLRILADRLGEAELAGHYLAEAERMVDRARINGVDSPDIYYTEAVLLTLRKNPAGAVAKLEQAVDKGFRGQWMLEVDSRIQSLRDADGYALLKNRIEQDIEHALGEIRALNLAML